MVQPSLRAVLCVLVVVLGGCLGGPSNLISSGTPTPTPVCIPPERGNGSLSDCLIDRRPPDLRYENQDDSSHTLTVRIVRNGSSVVFSRNVSLDPSADGHYIGRWPDVIESPGNYTITATMDDETTDTLARTFGNRWAGSGGPEWVVRILGERDVRILQLPHQ